MKYTYKKLTSAVEVDVRLLFKYSYWSVNSSGQAKFCYVYELVCKKAEDHAYQKPVKIRSLVELDLDHPTVREIIRKVLNI